MIREFDIVIVGAGAVGTTAAAVLAARAVCAPERVAVIADRLPPDARGADWDLRVFALGRASQRLLGICGVWDRLPRDRVCSYERMRVWDASRSADGPGALCFDCAEIGEPDLGSIVDGRALQWHCLQAARAAGVVVIEAGLRDVAIGETCARIQATDGRAISAQLVVAADGTSSTTRRLLGIDTAGHAYGADALVAHVRTAKPHHNTAWQRFLPTGPLAFLPLSDGRSSIVWSVRREQAARLRALDAAEFASALDAASAEVLGHTELTTPVAAFPLRLQYATTYVRERVALIGDAAHVVHPLAGQGLNLGFMDCGALASVLAEAQDAKAFGDLAVLRRYERWRKSENLPAAAAFDGVDRLFSNADPALTALRAAGLQCVARWPFAKRLFARRALGLAGDAPAFLRRAPADFTASRFSRRK